MKYIERQNFIFKNNICSKEKRAKEAKEKEDAMERDATERRLWSINFFGSKVRELSEESNQVRLKNKSALAHERQEALDKVVNEWEENVAPLTTFVWCRVFQWRSTASSRFFFPQMHTPQNAQSDKRAKPTIFKKLK